MSFSDELRRSYPADPKSQQIIKRWLKYAGADEMWKKLLAAETQHLRRKVKKREEQADKLAANAPWMQPHPAPPRLHPKEFIQVVLSARYGVERLIAYESKVKENFKGLKTEFAECIQAADSPREIEDAIGEYKPRFDAMNREIYDFLAKTPVSRKDQNGSRTKRAFTQRIQDYLQIRCGRRMTSLMPELQDIVFGNKGGKHHTEDDGRIARRATTNAGRGRR